MCVCVCFNQFFWKQMHTNIVSAFDDEIIMNLFVLCFM